MYCSRNVVRQNDPVAKHSAITFVPINIVWIAAFIFGAKVLGFASGDLTTAVEVARHLEFLPTITAMAISLVPLLALPLTILLLLKAREVRTPGYEFKLLVTVCTIVLGVAAIFSSGIVLVPITVWYSARAIYDKFLKGRERDFSWMKLEFDHIQPMVSLLLTLAVVAGPPWIATQQVRIDGDERSVFFLAEENGDVTFVDAETKTVEQQPSLDVTHRRLCSQGFSWAFSPLLQITSNSVYEACHK